MTQKKKDIHPSSRQKIERLRMTNLTSALNPQFAPEKNSPFHETLLKITLINSNANQFWIKQSTSHALTSAKGQNIGIDVLNWVLLCSASIPIL